MVFRPPFKIFGSAAANQLVILRIGLFCYANGIMQLVRIGL